MLFQDGRFELQPCLLCFPLGLGDARAAQLGTGVRWLLVKALTPVSIQASSPFELAPLQKHSPPASFFSSSPSSPPSLFPSSSHIK